MQEHPFAQLRRAVLANKGKNVCHVSSFDRAMIEAYVGGKDLIPIKWKPHERHPDAFLNFDGVWLVEDESLPQGEFRFSEMSDVQGPQETG